jgi:hypothetical protein
MAAYEQQHGLRILDYLDVHFYPQASGIFSTDAGSSATQTLRLRSTRALWDPTYLDESWINDYVKLIPRLRAWVARYPGTKIAISEYSWGALNSLNGALAQAEVLGVFGREGVDLAALWGPPEFSDPGAFAFRMYRNYDGQGSAFGDTSFQAASSDPSRLSIFAARRAADAALTLMVINKTSADIQAPIAVSHYSGAAYANVYRYSAANLGAIQSAAIAEVTPAGIVNENFPADSISLLVVPSQTGPLFKTYLPAARR